MPALSTTLYGYNNYWAECYGTAPELPMSRAEMDALGWDSCDIIIVTGDAYVDHPSFGMAIIGRLLEANGYRVGIIAQPDWHSKDDFEQLGRPNLYFGVAAGNMDSMINRYTADKKVRNDDAYTPHGVGGKRPDRCSLVYSQRCKEAYKDVPVVLGGIEASLRRIAHFDYWQEKVRRSVLVDAKADLLLYGNAERAIVELSHRLAGGEPIDRITDLRGSAFVRRQLPPDWTLVDSTTTFVNSPTRTGSKALRLEHVGDGVTPNTRTVWQFDGANVQPGLEYTYDVWVQGDNLTGATAGGRPLAVVRWRDKEGEIIKTFTQSVAQESFRFANFGTYPFTQDSMLMHLQAPAKAFTVDIGFRSWRETTGGFSYWDDVNLRPRNINQLGDRLASYEVEDASILTGGILTGDHIDHSGTGYYDVTVDGAVNSPGLFPVRGRLSLLQAVALAGGTSSSSNPKNVILFRYIEGERRAASFNLVAIRRGEADDPIIYGNDIVVVDGSDLRENYRDLIRSAPLLTLLVL